MSWFRYVIFSNPSTLYTLGLPPRNGGITEDCIRNWALHLNIWNLTLYICRSITHTEALPMPQHNHTGALPIPEHNHTWALPIPEHYNPCQSITHTEALPMPEHNNVKAYQCWSISMSEHTNIGAYKSAMLFTTTSCFHSFWDRANHTIPKIAIYSHIAIQTQWVLFQSTDCPGCVSKKDYCREIDVRKKVTRTRYNCPAI